MLDLKTKLDQSSAIPIVIAANKQDSSGLLKLISHIQYF